MKKRFYIFAEVHFVPSDENDKPKKNYKGQDYYSDKNSVLHEIPWAMSFEQAEKIAEFAMAEGLISSYTIIAKK